MPLQAAPGFMLGKAPPKVDARTLKLASYLDHVQLPPIPASTGWAGNVAQGAWDTLGNDQYGDCVEAGALHIINVWRTARGEAKSPFTEQDALSVYTAITGFNPNDPSTDNGTVMLDMLNYWRQTGLNGSHIGAYVQVDPHNKQEVDAAIYLFGSLYIGFQFPDTAMQQFQSGAWWDVRPGASIIGGHCVPVPDYTSAWYWCITWGRLFPLSKAFFDTYVDEAYALLGEEWLGATQAPNGFDLSQLLSDLQAVTA